MKNQRQKIQKQGVFLLLNFVFINTNVILNLFRKTIN